jgi:uncharacterized glyoxalase superfamily protein PhnB
MKPKISVVSLSVADLGRALAFYRDGLGFPTHNYADGDDFVFLKLEGAWLSLMARDAAKVARPPGASTISISHNAPSKAEVDAVYRLALSAGATTVQAPQDAPWGGYEAAFADPDGHVWGLAWNPFTDLT